MVSEQNNTMQFELPVLMKIPIWEGKDICEFSYEFSQINLLLYSFTDKEHYATGTIHIILMNNETVEFIKQNRSLFFFFKFTGNYISTDNDAIITITDSLNFREISVIHTKGAYQMI